MTASLGRVIEASIDRLTAVCHTLDGAPPLGALVVAEDDAPAIYAAVTGALTGGIDPGRRLAPRGGPGDGRAAVLAQNPQIPALLQTTFTATVTGHAGPGGEMRRYLPDAPAPVYALVRAATAAETAALCAEPDYLKLLLTAGPLADEVTAACLRRAAAHQPDSRAFLITSGRALAGLLAAEPDRLHAILRRIRP